MRTLRSLSMPVGILALLLPFSLEAQVSRTSSTDHHIDVASLNPLPDVDLLRLETYLMFEEFLPTLQLSDEQTRRFRDAARRMLERRIELESEIASEPEAAVTRARNLQKGMEDFLDEFVSLLDADQLEKVALFGRRFKFATQIKRYTTLCIQERQTLGLEDSQVDELMGLRERINNTVFAEVEPFRTRIQDLVKLEKEEVERALTPTQIQTLIERFGQDYRGPVLEPASRAFGVYSKRNFLRTSEVFDYEDYGLEGPEAIEAVTDEEDSETRRAMWILSGIVFKPAVAGDLELTREQINELERLEEEHRGSSMAVATLSKVMNVLVLDQQRRVNQLYTRSLFSMATGGRLAVYVSQFMAEDLELSDAQIDELVRVASALDERFDAECEVYHHNALRVFSEERAECMRILRPEQVAIVNQMLGEDFDDFEFGAAAQSTIVRYLKEAYEEPKR